LFDHIDFLDGEGQFVDRGYGYQSAVFYQTEEERIIIQAVIDTFNTAGVFSKPVETKVESFTSFYDAEEYHQDYHQKNTLKYSYYRSNSGRDARVKELCALREGSSLELCGSTAAVIKKNFSSITTMSTHNWSQFVKPTDKVLRDSLSEMSYYVTQQDGTERPFDNEYDKEYRAGIYVDIVSGEPLYSSRDKFDSGTGWPSFVRPISDAAVNVKTDWKLLYPRSEVRSVFANSHLGHVFDDGPEERGGKRYCMNSAALRFVQLSEMEKEGYGDYISAVIEE
jgi:peptide methionine sulfoxide reductase msrA/msrB